MNPRIKELEKQATTVVEGWSDENGTTRYYEFNRKKFAELIVRECAQVASDWVKEPTMLSIENKIKWRFGVK